MVETRYYSIQEEGGLGSEGRAGDGQDSGAQVYLASLKKRGGWWSG